MGRVEERGMELEGSGRLLRSVESTEIVRVEGTTALHGMGRPETRERNRAMAGFRKTTRAI